MLLNNAQEEYFCCKELHWAIFTALDLRATIVWPWDQAEHGLKT